MIDIEKLEQENKLHKNDGPCVKNLDDTLKLLNVERSAYHGRSFVGNHVHKLLKVSIFFIICQIYDDFF